MKMSAVDWVAFILVAVGAINWGLVGLFNFDLVATLLGDMSAISRIVYVLIGVAAVYRVVTVPGMIKKAV